jgi:hypothetical protein
MSKLVSPCSSADGKSGMLDERCLLRIASLSQCGRRFAALQERLKQVGSDLVDLERRSSDYLAQFVASEIRKWEIPIKSSGVQF